MLASMCGVGFITTVMFIIVMLARVEFFKNTVQTWSSLAGSHMESYTSLQNFGTEHCTRINSA